MINLNAEIEAVLPDMRRQAESFMTDTVHIGRPVGNPDPLTGKPEFETVYEGRGKVQSFRPYETALEVAGATVIQGRREVHIPYNVGPVVTGDVVTIVASRNQPLLAGQQFRVAFPDLKTIQTAQRLLVDQE